MTPRRHAALLVWIAGFALCVSACGGIDRLAYLLGESPPCEADANCPNDTVCVQGRCELPTSPAVREPEPQPEPQEPEANPGAVEPDAVPEPVPEVTPEPEPVEGCGDGTIDTALGEVCDDGNEDDQDGCSSTCQRWFDAAWPTRWEVQPVDEAPVVIGEPKLLLLGEDIVAGRTASTFCVVADDTHIFPTEVDSLAADYGLVWTLPTATFDTLWMYETDGDCPSEVGVFDAAYASVWHLGNDGLQSSVDGQNRLVEVGATETVQGVVGAATALDQLTNPLSRLTSGTQAVSLSGDLTIEAWVRVDFFGESNEWPNTIIECAGEGFFEVPCFLHVEEDGHLRVSWFSDNNRLETISSTEPIPNFALGQWHHVAQVRDEVAGFMTFYADGLPLGADVIIDRVSGPANAVRVRLGGSRDFESRSLHGALDEVRISRQLHSAAWIAAQYRNMTVLTLVNPLGEQVVDLGRP